MKTTVLALLTVLFGLSACGDKPQTVVIESSEVVTAQLHEDDYYHDQRNFTDYIPYYEMPYVDAYGVRKVRRVYRPNGLTATDLALGIAVGNMLSTDLRRQGRRPTVINKTIINKYEKKKVVRRNKTVYLKGKAAIQRREAVKKQLNRPLGEKTGFSLAPKKKKKTFNLAKKKSKPRKRSKKRRR